MQFGVVYPHTEIGADPEGIEVFVKGIERIGFRHLLAYDHVLGADLDVHGGLQYGYNVDSSFHEPLVLFGFIAALTTLELATGILILPQRQTALVAKQAAVVDCLAKGRLRLGVGIGWNPVEYDALGMSFGDRGARMEEQVALLRLLWTERSVTFRGRYEQVNGAGINPLPIQRPIPLWFGGQSPPAYRRTGRLADGWIPQGQPGPELDAAKAIVFAACDEAGRDPAAIGIEGRITINGLSPTELSDRVSTWEDFGATHISLVTMKAGLPDAEAHLAALETAADQLIDRPA